MTTKTPEKKEPAAGQTHFRPPQEDMQTAYQIHTLAQMLYGQISTPHPWTGFAHPASGFDPRHVHGAVPGMANWSGMWGAPTWTGPVYSPFGTAPMMSGFERFPR